MNYVHQGNVGDTSFHSRHWPCRECIGRGRHRRAQPWSHSNSERIQEKERTWWRWYRGRRMRTGFKRWDKKTRTSPSGTHLGIHKSLTNLSEQKEEKVQLLKVITEIISGAMTKCRTLSLIHNVLLEKDPNNLTLHRLRIIHVIEADYNLATKIIALRRCTMTEWFQAW